MDPRLRRRAALLGATLAAILRRYPAILVAGFLSIWVVAASSFGPIVRSAARSAAEKKHLAIEITSVRPGWFAVRLLGVVVRPEGVPSLVARLGEARIGLNFSFRAERVDLYGVSVEVRGSIRDVREELATWRALQEDEPRPYGSTRSARVVSIEGLSAHWWDGETAEPATELAGLGATWDRDGLRWRVASARLRTGPIEVAVAGGEGALDRSGMVLRARAGTVVVDLARPEGRAPIERSTPNALNSGDVPRSVDPGAPLVPIPDTHALRAEVALLSGLLSDRLREGADVGADAVTWRIARSGEAVPFTLGPGPLALTRSDAGFELKYSTDPHVATTPLALRMLLPRQGDPAISLEGGPVSLALLGVQEGGAGLVDVGRATITGRARLVLADDGSGLSFDGEGGARGLSLSNPRLALDVVRGLDVQVRALGSTSADGQIRIDELTASVGALHVTAAGFLDQKPDHVEGAFHFDVPRGSCQSHLDSLPAALLPALQGTRIAGNLAAHGRFAFDTRNLDALQLDYDVQDQCRVTEVPPELARERFQQPFSHRIFLPDGTLAEEVTGPGTANWTPLDDISPYMQVAVLTTEDGAFPRHHGFNRASIRLSLIANLKARRFARGASTITMQLAKNLFLSRDKTLSRKLEEVVLTDYLEQTFSKDELMELYLNVIEFGPATYGITAAAEHYFGRTPAELNLGECLFLSSLLPAPLRYGAMRDSDAVPDGWMRMLRNLMQVAHRNGRITDSELAESEKDPVVFWHGGERPAPRAPVRARMELEGDTDDVSTAPPLDAPQR